MCRMCLIYNEIDLKELPTSNPFSENVPTPIDPSVPECILIESPSAHQYPAWTGLRRFPSMTARNGGTTPTQRSSQITEARTPIIFPQAKASMTCTLTAKTTQPNTRVVPLNELRTLRRRTEKLTIQTIFSA